MRDSLKKFQFLVLIIALIKIYSRWNYYKRRLVDSMVFWLSKIAWEMATMARFPKSPRLSNFEVFFQVNLMMFQIAYRKNINIK